MKDLRHEHDQAEEDRLRQEERDYAKRCEDALDVVWAEELEASVIVRLGGQRWSEPGLEALARDIIDHGGNERTAGMLGKLGVAVMEELGTPATPDPKEA